MKIQQLGSADALRSVQSGALGLSGAEAARRLGEYGPNRVERIEGEPLILRFLREFTHFFALILWVAAALAFFAELNDPGKGMASRRWGAPRYAPSPTARSRSRTTRSVSKRGSRSAD